MKPVLKIAAILLFSISLVSCAGVRGAEVLSDIRNNPASGHYIEGVPFFPQKSYMCGPSSMASVFGFWGKDADMKKIAGELNTERLKGTLPMDLLIYAKEEGFDAKFYRGGLDDIRAKVSAGAPLIVFLNLGYEFYPVGHYMVVTGYDDKMKAVLAHSGVQADQAIPYDEFLKDWEKTGYSTLLITPKEKI